MSKVYFIRIHCTDVKRHKFWHPAIRHDKYCDEASFSRRAEAAIALRPSSFYTRDPLAISSVLSAGNIICRRSPAVRGKLHRATAFYRLQTRSLRRWRDFWKRHVRASLWFGSSLGAPMTHVAYLAEDPWGDKGERKSVVHVQAPSLRASYFLSYVGLRSSNALITLPSGSCSTCSPCAMRRIGNACTFLRYPQEKNHFLDASIYALRDGNNSCRVICLHVKNCEKLPRIFSEGISEIHMHTLYFELDARPGSPMFLAKLRRGRCASGTGQGFYVNRIVAWHCRNSHWIASMLHLRIISVRV